MRIRIFHQMVHGFSPPAKSLIQTLRLTPRNHEGQYVAEWRIDVAGDARLRSGVDAFGNITHRLSVDGPVREATVTVHGVVETHDTAGVLRGALERFPPGLYLRDTELTLADEATRAMAEEVRHSAGPEPLPILHGLMSRLHDGLPAGPDTAQEGREAAAHAFIAAARHLDIPARFVSGYAWGGLAEPERQGLHGWAEAHVEGLGWVGFDPTANLCPATSHVRLAMGLDALGAAPMRGQAHGFGEERLDVTVKIMAQSQSQS